MTNNTFEMASEDNTNCIINKPSELPTNVEKTPYKYVLQSRVTGWHTGSMCKYKKQHLHQMWEKIQTQSLQGLW